MNTIDTSDHDGSELYAHSSIRRGFVDRLALVLGSIARQIGRMLERRRGRQSL